jgi:RNA polymerase sigma factor (TIGR02999 family)
MKGRLLRIRRIVFRLRLSFPRLSFLRRRRKADYGENQKPKVPFRKKPHNTLHINRLQLTASKNKKLADSSTKIHEEIINNHLQSLFTFPYIIYHLSIIINYLVWYYTKFTLKNQGLSEKISVRRHSVLDTIYTDKRTIMADVTRILNAIEQGDPRATEELLPLIYEELRLLAAQKIAQEPPGQTLQATALVHEAYLRLVKIEAQNWDSRGHFFDAAAEAMRRILVDKARRKKSQRAGGKHKKIDLNDAFTAIEEPKDDILAVNEALDKLANEDTKLAEVIKLRYFGGLTLDQIAAIMGIGRRTADRYWALGRAWLYQEITQTEKK